MGEVKSEASLFSDHRKSQRGNCRSVGSGVNGPCGLTCLGATAARLSHWAPRSPTSLVPFPISHKDRTAWRPDPGTETAALTTQTSQVPEAAKEWLTASVSAGTDIWRGSTEPNAPRRHLPGSDWSRLHGSHSPAAAARSWLPSACRLPAQAQIPTVCQALRPSSAPRSRAVIGGSVEMPLDFTHRRAWAKASNLPSSKEGRESPPLCMGEDDRHTHTIVRRAAPPCWPCPVSLQRLMNSWEYKNDL